MTAIFKHSKASTVKLCIYQWPDKSSRTCHLQCQPDKKNLMWSTWRRRWSQCMSEAAAHFLWLSTSFRYLSWYSDDHSSTVTSLLYVSVIIIFSTFQMRKHTHIHIRLQNAPWLWAGWFGLVCSFFPFLFSPAWWEQQNTIWS